MKKKIKNKIGIALCLLPFLGLFIFGGIFIGFLQTSLIYLGVIGLIGYLAFATSLLE